jgi:N-acetylneuraminate synthase/N,N'-diacetyllegionaminate synthase
MPMSQELVIGGRRIGEGHPPFVMAEVGVTCNYDLRIARELIDATRDAGADAAKFIFWFPEEIMADRTVTYTYETSQGPRTENMFAMLDKLRFTFSQWQELKAYADRRGIVLFSTVNSPSGIEWAEKLGLEAYKLSSWDFNDLPLWRRIAALGKPMLIDTGPVDGLDVAKVMRVMKEAGNTQAALIHCVHTDVPAEVNMRSIPYLRSAFGCVVGYSSKDRASETDIMAVTLGASVLEKRLTLDRDLPGHHHVISLEPAEFKSYVRMIRDVHASLGAFDLIPSPADLAERKKWFRHLVAARPLPAGTRLTADMLESKRGEVGLSPEHLELVIGRELRRPLAKDETIEWADV